MAGMAVLAWAALTWATLFGSAEAAPPPPPTSLAFALSDGAVLAAKFPDSPRRPASLAKLMTLYIAFEAIAAGKVSEAAPVEISANAAGQPPVKAYLKPGTKAPLGDLIAAAGVASSNDAAMAVAEAVAGSEAAFVERMNAAAADLGMVNSRFVNPTGLPAAKDQAPAQTTARDLALLARAILSRHPERAAVLSRASVNAAGRRLSTTNPLLGSYPGAQGLKTGFTCKAGYSLAALAERDGRRVVAVSMGHVSKELRRQESMRLLDRAFAAFDGPSPKHVPTPRRRPEELAAQIRAERAEADTAKVEVVAAKAETVTEAEASTETDKEEAAAKLSPEAPRLVALAPAPESSASKEPPSVAACGRGGGGLRGWGVFLGAYNSRGAADKAIARAARYGGNAYVGRRKRGRRWAALVHALNRKTALRTCLAARRSGRYCVTLSPTALRHPRARWR